MAQKRSIKPACVLLASMFMVLVVSPTRGQTLKGTLLGTITDSTQAVVPAVQVSLTETNTNFHLTQTTNESGFYVFANLDPGNYRVEVEHTGFRKIVRSGIDLTPNSTVRVGFEPNQYRRLKVV